MVRCPACGSEERDGALYCGMCKHVFGRAAPPKVPPEALAWVPADGTGGAVLDSVTHAKLAAACATARATADHESAIAGYEAALALLPKSPLAWTAGAKIAAAIGELHLVADRFGAARKYLAQALQSAGGAANPMLRWNLGETEVECGDLANAQRHLADALAALGGPARVADRHPKYLACAKGDIEMTLLVAPPRPHEPVLDESYRAPLGPARILFVIYGAHASPPYIRTPLQVPRGIRIDLFTRGHDYFEMWIAPGVSNLMKPEHATVVRAAQSCVVISGDLVPGADLAELRRALALVSAACPPKGGAVYDPATLRWFTADEFRGEWSPGLAVAAFVRMYRVDHALITAGLRTFGRPDLVAVHTPMGGERAAADLLGPLVEALVLTGALPANVAGFTRVVPHLRPADRDNAYVENVWIELAR